jgi:hypothetical protein
MCWRIIYGQCFFVLFRHQVFKSKRSWTWYYGDVSSSLKGQVIAYYWMTLQVQTWCWGQYRKCKMTMWDPSCLIGLIEVWKGYRARWSSCDSGLGSHAQVLPWHSQYSTTLLSESTNWGTPEFENWLLFLIKQQSLRFRNHTTLSIAGESSPYASTDVPMRLSPQTFPRLNLKTCFREI